MKITIGKRRNSKAIVAAATASAGLTAGLFLLFGPGGGRRRGLARDRLSHLKHVATDQLDKAARDFERRTEGVVARVRGTNDDVGDYVLGERARAALGHVCSHPHAVKTSVKDGVLLLEGPVLAAERHQIVKELRKVHGIREVRDLLEVHANPDLPALQGGRHRERRPELLQENWSPATRLVVGSAAVGLVALAGVDRRPWSIAGGALGGLMLLRAIWNGDPREALRGPYEVHKSIFIKAPRDDVFALFQKVEHFPRFMTHVKEVRKIDDDHYVWRVDGPFGSMTELCELKRWQPSEGISWASVDDGAPRVQGQVRFLEEEGGTRLEIMLSYRPPIGGVGYVLGKALHRDPKRLLDDDLLRLKSLIENGKATGKREQVLLADVVAPTSPT